MGLLIVEYKQTRSCAEDQMIQDLILCTRFRGKDFLYTRITGNVEVTRLFVRELSNTVEF